MRVFGSNWLAFVELCELLPFPEMGPSIRSKVQTERNSKEEYHQQEPHDADSCLDVVWRYVIAKGCTKVVRRLLFGLQERRWKIIQLQVPCVGRLK